MISRIMKKNKEILAIFLLATLIPSVLSTSLSTDKQSYNLGESVLISGVDFPPSTDVIIQINDPNGLMIFVDQVMTIGEGSFLTAYAIPDDSIAGYFVIYASSESFQIQGNFTVTRFRQTTTTVSGSVNGSATTTSIITTTTYAPASERTTTTRKITTTTTVSDETGKSSNKPDYVLYISLLVIFGLIGFYLFKKFGTGNRSATASKKLEKLIKSIPPHRMPEFQREIYLAKGLLNRGMIKTAETHMKKIQNRLKVKRAKR